MSTNHFTPGPWRVAESSEPMAEDGTVCESPNGWEIRPGGHQKLGSEAADLRLIAAAPDLLAALAQAHQYVPPSSPVHRQIMAAIAKATGAQP